MTNGTTLSIWHVKPGEKGTIFSFFKSELQQIFSTPVCLKWLDYIKNDEKLSKWNTSEK